MISGEIVKTKELQVLKLVLVTNVFTKFNNHLPNIAFLTFLFDLKKKKKGTSLT